MPLFRDYTRATDLEPTDAFVLDRESLGTMYIEAQDMFAGGPYLAAISCLGAPLTSSELAGGHVFVLPVTLPVNLGATKFYCDTLPTAVTVFHVYRIAARSATSIGTVTVATDGGVTNATAATAFNVNDSIKFVGPASADASLANFWWTLVATVRAT